MNTWEAVLYLENGHSFHGLGFGSDKPGGGELVFNTGMTGYQEIFSDPSYSHQIVMMTYPHLGNTGVNEEDIESSGLFLKGVVARQYEPHPSSWRSRRPLHEYLHRSNVPGISEVDTREITRVVRGEGGLNVRKADLLTTVETTEGALEAAELFFQYYRENANYLERTYDFVERLGIEKVRKETVYAPEETRRALLDRLARSKARAKDAWLEGRTPVNPTQFTSLVALDEAGVR